jgi:hypothetical protein
MERSVAVTRASWWSLALLGSGCSLFGLDDFETVRCVQNNESCRALNQQLGIDMATASHAYQCASDGVGCELRPLDWDNDGALSSNVPAQGDDARDCDDGNAAAAPGLTEVCDREDNDCDGVIDEGLFVGEPVQVADLGEIPQVGVEYDFGQVATSRLQHSLDFAMAHASGASSGTDDPSSLGEAGLTLRTLGATVSGASPVVVSPLPKHDGPNCPGADSSEGYWKCAPAAIASDGEALEGHLAAAIDRLNSAEGRVRVGEIRGETLQVAGEPLMESCTGGYPYIAPDSHFSTFVPGVVGASRLELSRLAGESGAAQALVAWAGTSELGHGACGRADEQFLSDDHASELDRDQRTAVGVAALGIWHDPVMPPIDNNKLGRRSVGVTRVDGRENPQVLGTTRGGAAPAIEPVQLSDGEAHYIVAFGSDDGPALRAIERFDALSNQCAPGVDGNVELQVRSTAAPWSTAKPPHARADYLTLAGGPEIDDACGTGARGLRVGVAWLEGCGLSDASLWFATVDFAPSTGFCSPTEPALARKHDLSSEHAPVAPLALAYMESGVSRGEVGGGYYLAAIEPGRAIGVQRFSARDGALVDSEPLMVGSKDAYRVALGFSGENTLELYSVHGAKHARLMRAHVASGCAP